MRLQRTRLKLLRAKNLWNQGQAAKAAGIGITTYRFAENGKNVQLLKAQAIADAFKVDLEELVDTDPTADEDSNAVLQAV